mmetsp:Transcript_82247/g.172190  ORF Transcript_82247/g.172190 Transcript_82247/m.172190 type:complete len:399 (-) Transcript_82247:64-1260(-)
MDLSQKLVGGLQFLLWVACLDDGRDDSNVLVLSGDIVSPGDHHDVDVVLPLELLLRHDDLAGVGRASILVLGVRDRGTEDADRPHHLSDHPSLCLSCVGGVADHHLALRDLGGSILGMGLDARDLALGIELEAVNRLVQHVDASVDGGEPGEALRQAAEAVQGIDEGGTAVLQDRVQVELALVDGGSAGLVQVLVIDLKSDGVTDEVDGALLETVLLVDLGHGVSLRVDALVGGLLVILPIHDKLGEVDEARLLEDAHQRGLQTVLRCGGDLMDVLRIGEETGFLELVDVCAITTLPFQIPRDARLEQDLHQVSRCHDELGDEVNIPFAVGAQLLGGLGSGPEALPQIRDVQGRALAAVVGITVQMEDLLAVNGQQAAQDALLEAGAADADIILLVHV